jgi:uncharacterized protein (TIGR02391 family)
MALDILQTALRGPAAADADTTRRLYDFIPDPEDVLRLEPEELAGVVLTWLNPLHGAESVINRQDLIRESTFQGYGAEYVPRLRRALMEAWGWLVRENLVALHSDNMGYFITRRGQRIKTDEDLTAYRMASLLPRECLHPLIVQKVAAAFHRGEYDTAVFQAFREVEVQVQAAAGFGTELVGTSLMREAFKRDGGPLTDTGAEGGERGAMMALFAGAVGSFKNLQSHRGVKVVVHEAVELLGLASFLLKTVDARVAAKAVADSRPPVSTEQSGGTWIS